MSYLMGDTARGLRFTPVGNWLERYDPNDPEHCPPRIAMELVRRELAVPDEEYGGYRLTAFGLNVAHELREAAHDH